MENSLKQWQQQAEEMLAEFQQQAQLSSGQILVIGCSTSEMIGKKIGTVGAPEAAEVIYNACEKFADDYQINLAFQCCEHLNRALVVERKTAERKNLEIVSVVPVRKAGGSMATYAYEHFSDPVVVEYIKADAGIDIGDTLIGMHLKHVAVPVRTASNKIGEAHITMAKTRPKLIGGERAVYEKTTSNSLCS